MLTAFTLSQFSVRTRAIQPSAIALSALILSSPVKAVDFEPLSPAVPLSLEGMQVSPYQGVFSVAVYNDVNHQSGATIELTFTGGIDLSGADISDITVNAGSFFAVTPLSLEGRTLTLLIDNGPPMPAGSRFQVDFAANSVAITDLVTVHYQSTRFNGEAIESGEGEVLEVASQFQLATSNAFDQLIDFYDHQIFLTGSDDSLTLSLDVDTSLSGAIALADNDAKLILSGDFSDALWQNNQFVISDGTASVNGQLDSKDQVSFAITDLSGAGGSTSLDATKNWQISISPQAGTDLPQTSFELTTRVDYGGIRDAIVTDEINVGQWRYNASVVNVPYLPVGYSHIQSQLQVVNHSHLDADIVLKAFDQDGNQYDGYLPSVIAYGRQTFVDNDIQMALGLDIPRKLNIMVMTNTDADEVTIVPIYQEGDSRIITLSDEYK